MTTTVLFLDRDHAKLLKIKPGSLGRQNLHRTEMKHHTNADPENHKDTNHFFKQVADALRDSDEIYLMGPGVAKENFRSHLESHHHEDILSRIVGGETVDHISENEMLDHSRKFFKVYDLYA